jgi:hypothetical protein
MNIFETEIKKITRALVIFLGLPQLNFDLEKSKHFGKHYFHQDPQKTCPQF